MTQYLTRQEFTTAHKDLEDKVDSLTKLVYTGMGIIITLQFVWGLIPKFL